MAIASSKNRRALSLFSVDPLPFLDHVPKVDPDTEPRPPVFRVTGVPGLQFVLDLWQVHDVRTQTVLMPVNPAEPTDRSFIDIVLPAALEKGMGVIGMKVYFRGFASKIPGFSGMEPYFRFALSHPVSTVVIGCDNIEQVEVNVRLAESFESMADKEMKGLIEQTAPYAKQLMYYKP